MDEEQVDKKDKVICVHCGNNMELTKHLFCTITLLSIFYYTCPNCKATHKEELKE